MRRVSKTYRDNGQPVPVLHEISLAAEAGTVTALVGRSGCGKTTLLNLAGAMDFPTSGEVLIDGRPTAALSERELTQLRRGRIGFVFQFFQLLPTLTALENVELPLLLAGAPKSAQAALDRLRWVGLADKARSLPYQLSGGEMQRVAIARALVHTPDILIADEPTGNLDTASGDQVLALIRQSAAEFGAAVLHGHALRRSRRHRRRARAPARRPHRRPRARMKLLRALILRPLRRDLLRTALTVLSVALGVAVVVAIDLAGDAATGSFRSSLETLTGTTDLEILANGGIDETCIARLAALPIDARFTPVIETQALVDAAGAVTLYGIDWLPPPDDPARAITVSSALARRLKLEKGATLRLELNEARREFRVAEIAAARDAEFLAIDIATAQQALDRYGKLDRIDVRIGPREDFAAAERAIRAALPASYFIEKPGARGEENQRMLRAFRYNLRVLSYISLVVGAFLIYNTIAVSVVRRRAEIGVLRALGAGRRAVLWLFLGEALMFGLAGGRGGRAARARAGLGRRGPDFADRQLALREQPARRRWRSAGRRRLRARSPAWPWRSSPHSRRRGRP